MTDKTPDATDLDIAALPEEAAEPVLEVRKRISARVAAAPGSRRPAPRPWIRPAPTAQAMASRAQSETSRASSNASSADAETS